MIGGESVPLSTNDLIVDSGTSYMLMPKPEFMAVIKMLSKQFVCQPYDDYPEMYYCECSFYSFFNFPDLQMVIDGVVYTIPRSSYVQMYGWNTCQLNLMFYEDWSLWILGLNFFHNYYAVFDQGKSRVGFAQSIYGD